jgi:hypothetical protein
MDRCRRRRHRRRPGGDRLADPSRPADARSPGRRGGRGVRRPGRGGRPAGADSTLCMVTSAPSSSRCSSG